MNEDTGAPADVTTTVQPGADGGAGSGGGETTTTTTTPAETTKTQAAPVETTTEAKTEGVKPEDKPAVEPWKEKFKATFPKKYIKDGEPDIEQLISAHKSLEQKIGHKVPVTNPEDLTYEWSEARADSIDPEAFGTFKKLFADAGYNQEQFQVALKIYEGIQDQNEWSTDRATTFLKDSEQWGSDFDKNARAAHAAIEAYGASDITDFDDPVWNHPAVMKFAARVGLELTQAEVSPVKNSGGANTKDAIQEQIKELRSSPDYYSEENQRKMNNLYAKLEKAK